MIKKLFSLLITTILIFTPLISKSFADSITEVKILIDGNLKDYPQSAVLYNDVTMVPLRGIFESLGAEVKWVSESKKVIATKEENKVELVIDSSLAFKNNISIQLNIAPMILNGHTMVPLRFVSEALGAKVVWNESNKTVEIFTNNDKIEDNVKTSENTVNNLSLEDAIKSALTHSYQLKNSQKDIEKAEEIQDNYGDYFYLMTPGGGGNSLLDAQLSQLYLGSLSSQEKLQIAKLDQKVKEEEIKYSVKKAYNDVIKKEFEREFALKSLNLEQLNFQIARVQLSQGVISDTQFEQLQNKLKEKVDTLEIAENKLKESRIVLNKLMGKEVNSVYTLIDKPVYKTLNDDNVDYRIAKVMEEDPRIFKLEKNKELAEKAVTLYTYNSGNIEDSFKTRQLDAEKAENQLADTKQMIKESVHSIYLNIKSLEDQYQILKVNYENIEKNYKVAKVEFEVGKITKLHLQQIEVQLSELENKMLDLLIQLDNLHILYEKPWLAQAS